MISLYPSSSSRSDQIQSRLFIFATIFVFLDALMLTISPAVRLRSWSAVYNWQHWIGFVVWLAAFVFIHRQSLIYLPNRDPFLIPIAALLTGWGLLTIWRLDPYFGLRQTFWLIVSITLFWIGIKSPKILNFLRRYKYIWLISGLILTGFTLFFGTYPSGEGPHQWLGCCGIYLQPSEPLKLLLVIYLAAYLADRLPIGMNLMKMLTPTLVLIGAALVVLFAQRDLGTGTLFILLYFIITYLATGKKRILLIGILILILSGVLGYQVFEVIRNRVDTLINPWLDPSGKSFQIIQSLMAIANGGVFGTGIGMGSPGLVPVAHSDFIFVAIAEETGLVGTLAVILLLSMFFIRGLRTSLNASNNYQRFLAAGVTTFITVQSVLIIAGNLRLLPLTGVTLPFVSYGGSSLLTSYLALLFLCLISNQSDESPFKIHQAQTYKLTGSFILGGLCLISLLNGWWAFVRAPSLNSRTDNPRRSIDSQYVMRGSLLDRNNIPIAASTGMDGNLTRELEYTPLSPVIGYSNYTFGQAGLEARLDNYLRGLQGNPSSLVWYNHLVYNQPPPGLDVRLSIDLSLQKTADDLMGDYQGALILINSQTGEILVSTSHPYFDSNKMTENWSEYINNPQAPLINRVVQGQYSVGSSLAPFFLARAIDQGLLPADVEHLSYMYNNQEWKCAFTTDTNTWETSVMDGCPGAAFELGSAIGLEGITDVMKQLKLDQAPQIDLPIPETSQLTLLTTIEGASLGLDNFKVSPLQMVLAAAVFSSGGKCPSPLLSMAVHTSYQGWVILPGGGSSACFSELGSASVASLLSLPDLPIWQSVANAQTPGEKITWYLGGTTKNWLGTPLTLVIALEEDNPQQAALIGQTLLERALKP